MLYLADYPEAVTFIKGNVSRIRAFEVSRDAVLVASSKSMFHQQRAEPLADPARISGDEGQIPMWLVGMMFGHTLQDRAKILGDLRAQASVMTAPIAASSGLPECSRPRI